MSKRRTIAIAVGIWLLSMAVSSPNFIFYTTYRHNMADGRYRIVCYMEWPDGASGESRMENA